MKPTILSRRAFLRNTTFTAACGLLAFGLPQPLAAAPAPARLVIVFQRGGADGLNTIVPYGDSDYYAARPELAIAPPGAGAGRALDLDGFFGLHPALAPLLPMYGAGELAIVPCVGHDDASRSHFDAQDQLEIVSANVEMDGWLNRYLQHHPGAIPLRAVSFGGRTARMFHGSASVSVFNDLEDFTLSSNPAAANLVGALGSVYQAGADSSRYRDALRTAGRVMLEDFDLVRGTTLATDGPGAGVAYPESPLGRHLMQTARLLKSDVGTELVSVNSPGWDTHANQGTTNGRQAASLSDLALALAAFRDDMGAGMDSTLVLVQSEFGRTLRGNASAGTDHGRASAWMAFGAGVQGGIHLGPSGWPGLSDGQLFEGRYLRHTVDYRDIYAEVISRHMASPRAGDVLLGYSANPLGLIA